MNIQTRVLLNNQVGIPMLGFGTFKISPDRTAAAVRTALQAGYRHIDTAAYYQNEKEVGQAIRESGIPRSEIFVTTKLHPEAMADPVRACEASLRQFGMEYADLYLIHHPLEDERWKIAWRAMGQLIADGKARAIGVSNFTRAHLRELLAMDNVLVPAVNQVEFSPYLYERDLLAFCRENGILLEAYSPLTRGQKLNDLRLQAIAARYHKTPAQILIRWILQHGIVALPKSEQPVHIRENADVFEFEISREDMAQLDRFDERFRVFWGPEDKE